MDYPGNNVHEILNKLSEMQNLSMVFKSNFNYYHRVEHAMRPKNKIKTPVLSLKW